MNWSWIKTWRTEIEGATELMEASMALLFLDHDGHVENFGEDCNAL